MNNWLHRQCRTFSTSVTSFRRIHLLWHNTLSIVAFCTKWTIQAKCAFTEIIEGKRYFLSAFACWTARRHTGLLLLVLVLVLACACISFNYLVIKRFWKIHWMPGSWNCIEGKFQINCGFDRIRNEWKIVWNFISQRKTSHRIFLVSAMRFLELEFLFLFLHMLSNWT